MIEVILFLAAALVAEVVFGSFRDYVRRVGARHALRSLRTLAGVLAFAGALALALWAALAWLPPWLCIVALAGWYVAGLARIAGDYDDLHPDA